MFSHARGRRGVLCTKRLRNVELLHYKGLNLEVVVGQKGICRGCIGVMEKNMET